MLEECLILNLVKFEGFNCYNLQCQRQVNILNIFAWLSSSDSQRYARKTSSVFKNDGNYCDLYLDISSP